MNAFHAQEIAACPGGRLTGRLLSEGFAKRNHTSKLKVLRPRDLVDVTVDVAGPGAAQHGRNSKLLQNNAGPNCPAGQRRAFGVGRGSV